MRCGILIAAMTARDQSCGTTAPRGSRQELGISKRGKLLVPPRRAGPNYVKSSDLRSILKN
jgi:hypothetical protein